MVREIIYAIWDYGQVISDTVFNGTPEQELKVFSKSVEAWEIATSEGIGFGVEMSINNQSCYVE